MSPSAQIAKVVLDTRLPQLDRLFDYAIPKDMVVTPGIRVKVPLRSQARLASGFVVDVAEESSWETLSELHEVVSEARILDPDIWALAQRIAQRSAGNVADVLRLAIPPRSVRVEKAWLSRTPAVRGPLEPPGNTLEGYPETALESLLSPGSRTWLKRTSDDALAMLALHAVTRGTSAIVVVPDWRDIETLGNALRALIPSDYLSVVDPGLSPSEKYRQFLRCLEPDPVVVVGARHSVYAPVTNLGLIVVVDDIDTAHQEQLAPYPHTRDIALLRQSSTNSAVVFASRVPSLPVVRWMQVGFVEGITPYIEQRPTIIPTALALGKEHSYGPARIPSQAYQGAKDALRKGPVLVQVYRAGFSLGLACGQCGLRRVCERCHGPLAHKTQGSLATCGWCGLVDSRRPCEDCGSTSRKPLGFGVERTASDLGKAFPGVTIVQSDGAHRVVSVPDKPALVVSTRGSEPRASRGYQAALLLDGGAMLQRPSLAALEESVAGWEHAISLVRPEGQVFFTEVTGSPALAVASGNYLPLLIDEWSARERLKLPPAIRFVSIEGGGAVVHELVTALQTRFAEVSALGPIQREDGSLRSVVRFPYSLGGDLPGEVRSFLLKNLSRKGTQHHRLRVSFDTASTFDSVVNDESPDQRAR